MNTQNVGWTDVSDIDAKMRVAALMPAPEAELSPNFIKRRDDERATHDYSVTVDENLLIIQGGKSAYSDGGTGGLVIPLPFVRGISPICECYTKGSGSSVNLFAFGVTLAGRDERIQIYQGEPFHWYGDKKAREAREVEEMAWHKRQLVIQRQEILSAINAYINRVRNLEPEDRQLKLGL